MQERDRDVVSPIEKRQDDIDVVDLSPRTERKGSAVLPPMTPPSGAGGAVATPPASAGTSDSLPGVVPRLASLGSPSPMTLLGAAPMTPEPRVVRAASSASESSAAGSEGSGGAGGRSATVSPVASPAKSDASAAAAASAAAPPAKKAVKESPSKISLHGETVVTHWRHVRWSRVWTHVFPPSSVIMATLNAIFLTAVLYNLLIVFVRYGFADEMDEEWHWAFIGIDVFVDAVYVLEMAVALQLGFLKEGILVTSRKRIRKQYMRTYLAVDVISLLPIHFISFSRHVYPHLRLVRLLRLNRFSAYWREWERNSRYASQLRLFKMMLVLLATMHAFGCVYFAIVHSEGFGHNMWVPSESLADASLARKYFHGLYWAGTFMTGANNAIPSNSIELYFSILVLITGIVLFAVIIATIGSIIGNMNRGEASFREKMSTLDSYMSYRKLPVPLRKKIRSYYEYLYSRSAGYNDEDIISDLPSHLQTEVSLHLTREMIEKVSFFENCSQGFINSLVVMLRPAIYSPGDAIVSEGDVGREMFFLSRGTVVASGAGFRRVMDQGSFFGEIALLFKGKRTATIRALTYCDVFVLQKADLDALLIFYPDQESIIRKVAEERLASEKQKKASAGIPEEEDEESKEKPKLVMEWRGLMIDEENVRSKMRTMTFGQLVELKRTLQDASILVTEAISAQF